MRPPSILVPSSLNDVQSPLVVEGTYSSVEFDSADVLDLLDVDDLVDSALRTYHRKVPHPLDASHVQVCSFCSCVGEFGFIGFWFGFCRLCIIA